MDARKDYVAPAIAWEDVLEQTSLACHATQPFPIQPVVGECFAGFIGPNFAEVFPCEINVEKGGAFAAIDGGCDINVELDAVVVLS